MHLNKRFIRRRQSTMSKIRGKKNINLMSFILHHIVDLKFSTSLQWKDHQKRNMKSSSYPICHESHSPIATDNSRISFKNIFQLCNIARQQTIKSSRETRPLCIQFRKLRVQKEKNPQNPKWQNIRARGSFSDPFEARNFLDQGTYWDTRGQNMTAKRTFWMLC